MQAEGSLVQPHFVRKSTSRKQGLILRGFIVSLAALNICFRNTSFKMFQLGSQSSNYALLKQLLTRCDVPNSRATASSDLP